MDEEFKVGDVVQLKSGGPAMTISAWMSKEIAVCRWFPELTIRETSEEAFPVQCLQTFIKMQ